MAEVWQPIDMLVDFATGNVGINTTSPNTLYKLHVVNSRTTNGSRAVYGETSTGYTQAIYGQHASSGNWGSLGSSASGVEANSPNFAGVYGTGSVYGVYGGSTENNGICGSSTSGVGVRGISSTGSAGWFQGPVTITGFLNKSGGGFKIDHPQDPENKYLQHSFVESPEMKNIYEGNCLLDDNGEAMVEMPSYFEVLNRDFHYQLTCIGGYAPIYVAEKVKSNSFKIAGGSPGLEVSWQVTGVRQDPFANAHPIVVEQEKPANEKGLYLNPKEWGQPAEKTVNLAPNK